MKKQNTIFIILIIIFILIILGLIINYKTKEEGSLIEITYKELLEKTKNEEDFILIVSQTTCSHCLAYKPRVKNICKKYNIDVYYIDYDQETSDDQKEFLETFGLDGSTPITMFFRNGTEVSKLNRIEGEITEAKALSNFKKMGFIEED